jgi:peptidylprolyl isomerase
MEICRAASRSCFATRRPRRAASRSRNTFAAALLRKPCLFLVLRPGGTKPSASPTNSPTTTATPCPGPTPAPPKKLSYPSAPADSIDENKIYVATFDTSCGSFKIRMDPKVAPKTVNNFVFLARAGFYDGSRFHRIQNESDFAIVQGGDPEKGDGTGGPGYSYDGETPAPSAKYTRGTIAMANSGSPASNGSQFFVVVKDWAGLPPQYTIFGQVIDESNSFIALDKMITAQGEPIQGGQLGTTPNPPIFIIKVTIEELARS